MRNRSALRIVCLVLLAAIGVVLYADLQSVHQIFRITDKMIRDAPDDGTRNNLMADREKRNREEQRHKIAIEGALAVDALLFGYLAIATLRRPKCVSRVVSNSVA
jgi:hypothetical protein